MLEELNVRNFALIDSLNISLENGFTVLTGETGAGKSIIVGSLSFLMGSKADTEVIRSGCEEAGVSAVVSVGQGNADALDWLKSRDIETDGGRLVIRRSVKKTGRSSIYIKDAPVTRNDLAEFMNFIFDLHGQHTPETLLRKETHRLYLDRFANLEEEAAAFNKVFMELSERRKALEALSISERDREARLELLNYAVEEITKAAIKNGEIKELEAETQRLGDFEKLSQQVNTAAASLFEGEASLLGQARKSRAALESASAIDNSLGAVLKRIEDVYYETEDLAQEFRGYRDSLSYDPARLEEAEERLSLLYKLKKKYRPAGKAGSGPAGDTDLGLVSPLVSTEEEGILAYKIEAEAEIEALSGAGENQDKIRQAISALEKDIAARAGALSAKRKEGAKRLGTGITAILAKLGMPKGVFSAQVSAKTKEGGTGMVCGPWGADEVEFMISANTGEPLKELAKIASGGELSRVMLAIKTILCGSEPDGSKLRENEPGAGKGASGAGKGGAKSGYAETLVFDEVDTGIGGEVALSVGEYLYRMGDKRQIFCVTHLASIAVRADNHLRVEKKIVSAGSGADRTVTGVAFLKPAERRQEIARMLAGESGSAALAHADELLAKYGRG